MGGDERVGVVVAQCEMPGAWVQERGGRGSSGHVPVAKGVAWTGMNACRGRMREIGLPALHQTSRLLHPRAADRSRANWRPARISARSGRNRSTSRARLAANSRTSTPTRSDGRCRAKGVCLACGRGEVAPVQAVGIADADDPIAHRGPFAPGRFRQRVEARAMASPMSAVYSSRPCPIAPLVTG